ncbi:HupE/UreJ family protein [Paraglaciecola sp. L3A3]|uniref:HupE/UreJ family protein n=1 Tax=Paraglaciecola sp. L3A3 TaxID=2686358 RepID=UPI00131C271A|nr:HupE/UreJ family protein [Paraglaciecola sp. L3A3]
MNKIKFIILLSTLFISNLVYAHEMSGGGGFITGLTHPVLGLDHLLAMLSVGILSLQIGGRAIWMVPATFVLVMLIGGVLGMQEIALFSVELGIAISVLVLGIAIAIDKKLSPLLAMLFVSFFAIFHGHAHGTEMPYLSSPVFYALGFVLSTACIHLVGVFLGYSAKSLNMGSQLLKFLGLLIAAIGVYLCYNTIF